MIFKCICEELAVLQMSLNSAALTRLHSLATKEIRFLH